MRPITLFDHVSILRTTAGPCYAALRYSCCRAHLDTTRREIVLKSLKEVCKHRTWTLLAAHVRSNHVHIVVGADETAERVMNTFKIYASRALNAAGLDSADRNRWSRHGSTRHLYTKDSITAAMHYVWPSSASPPLTDVRGSLSTRTPFARALVCRIFDRGARGDSGLGRNRGAVGLQSDTGQ
jgi:REP element-mobilizing transposase RayT